MARVASAQMYQRPELVVDKSILSRDVVKFRPTVPGTFASGAVTDISFSLPRSGIWLDRMDTVRLQFSAIPTSVGGTYVRFSQYIWNLFDRLEITQSGHTIVNQRFFSDKMNSEYLINGDPNSQMGRLLWGEGSQAERNTLGAASNMYDFPIEIFRHLSADNDIHVLPLSELSGPLEVRLFFANPAACVECDGTTPGFTITNPRFVAQQIIPSSSQRAAMVSDITAGKYRFGIVEATGYQYTMVSGSTAYNIPINVTRLSVRDIAWFMRTASTLLTTTTNDRHITYNWNSLSTAQYHIEGVLIPSENVSYGATNFVDGFHSTMASAFEPRALDWIPRARSLITAANYVNDALVVAQDFKRNSMQPWVVSGRSTTNGSNIQVDVTLSGALGANQTVSIFVYSDAILSITPQGDLFMLTGGGA
mgnify:CR=1 FL=1